MLPHSKRLSTALFKKVIMEGKPCHSSLFVLRIAKTDKMSRFSVSVPKKVAKTAVLRNKIRRRAYSALRPLVPRINPHIQGVFVVKSAILSASLDQISTELTSFFGKLGFLT